MRSRLILLAAPAMAIFGLGFAAPGIAATSMMSSNKSAMMHSHAKMHSSAMHRSNTGLGSMRHPTVGNTANQRTNGG